MIEITWSISSIEVGANDGVVRIHWLCLGTKGDHREAEKGTAEFIPNPDKDGYVVLSDLTNDIVLSWLSKDKAERMVQEALNVEPTQLREVTL